MRGITEERLKEVFIKLYWSTSDDQELFTALLSECTELNAWQPIDENTPKFRPVLIRFFEGKEVGILTYEGWQSTYAEDFIESPTHWQELPEDPK